MVFLSLECHFHGVWELCGVLVEFELRVVGSHREVLVRGLVGLMVVLLDAPYSSSVRV
jgi:hypothetical protein